MGTAAKSFAADVEARRQRLAVVGRMEVVNELGHPEPPSEVVKRLPPECRIKWVPGGRFQGVAYFGIFQKWGPNDPRWQKVQSGEVPEDKAWDLAQMFPRECPPAEMAAYVEHRWGVRNIPKDPKAEADRLVAEAAVLYEKAREDNIDRAVENSNERSVRESNHDLHVRAGLSKPSPQVTVAKQIGNAPDGPKRLITP